eukprot:TRINITY_DN23593_c0_g1_i2.p1 TRINITY_DN23593_c0_g1~~TRINITY_DN23593_c0_g1_i2.p1  ORF type:complete len:239 (+),score=20.33 TRINITY_DN23593_c0_g1_i2:71-787(+)
MPPSRLTLMKAPLVGSEEDMASTDTGSELETPPTPSTRRKSSSSTAPEGCLFPVSAVRAQLPRSAEGPPLQKKAAPGPNSRRIPAKKQRQQRGGAHRGDNAPVGLLRSALRDKGNEVMSEMSASSRQPRVTALDWLEGATATFPPPGLEMRPQRVPDRWAPDITMAETVVDDRYYTPACHKYRPCAPTYSSPVRRVDAPSSLDVCFQAPYNSWAREGDRAPIVWSAPVFVDSKCWISL